MGDRANFGFTEDTGKPTLFLYAHNGGYEMLNTLAQALEAARPRWSDSAYGTRIAVTHMVGNDWNQEYGYGLTIDTLCDNEHSIPVVNWGTQTVSLYGDLGGTPKFTMSIEAFVAKFSKASILV